ncbi:MAG: hypothetical protein LBK95_11915 [Bifidobacteriaceae bacterium]|nr:hypothetical protein [Bifidobacteriaceae bacterium]
MDASGLAQREQVEFMKVFMTEVTRLDGMLAKLGKVGGVKRRHQLATALAPLVMERVWEDPALRDEAVSDLHGWLMGV